MEGQIAIGDESLPAPTSAEDAQGFVAYVCSDLLHTISQQASKALCIYSHHISKELACKLPAIATGRESEGECGVLQLYCSSWDWEKATSAWHLNSLLLWLWPMPYDHGLI